LKFVRFVGRKHAHRHARQRDVLDLDRLAARDDRVGVVAWTSTRPRRGLITTSMRDQVSWAFYIGNFTFLVGVAAAAVLLVIPAYVYNWKPIKEVVILGELLAISAIVMCGLFVTVDVGQPERCGT
jgi:Ni/Fe-hydrogenase subunit HybB-like protein